MIDAVNQYQWKVMYFTDVFRRNEPLEPTFPMEILPIFTDDAWETSGNLARTQVSLT